MSGGPWHNLVGRIVQYGGTSGTIQLGAGECVLLVVVSATAGGATLSVLGGASVPVVANAPPMTIQNFHTLLQANSVASTIVCTGTASYYIQTCRLGNTAT